MGALHPDAVRQFVERERDDHDWMKDVPSRQLSLELERLGIHRDPDNPWMKHQKVCLLLGIAHKAFAIWLDMGLGKSRVAIRLIRYFLDQSEISGALITAYSEPAVKAWQDEIEKWDPTLPFVRLRKTMSTAEKWAALEKFERGAILASYGGLRSMVTDLKEQEKKPGRRQFLNHSRVRRLGRMIQCCVTDESTELSNQDSRISQVFYQLRKTSPCFFELSGTPVGRDPTVLWRQLHILDRGETLGETLGMFRAAFFESKKNYWGGTEHEFDWSKKDQLYRILKHRSITYDESECSDLPPVVPKIEEVRLPAEATSYYKRFVQQIKQQHMGISERKGTFVRMRQVASGYVGFRDDETGEKAEIEFAVNPKIERLMELVTRVPRRRKFVIWHEFNHTGRIIERELKKLGIAHQWLWGGTTNQSDEILDRFNHDDDDRGLLINHFVGAFSQNLQRANYEFIVEPPVSAIRDRQMRKRLPRGGQTRTVFRYDLVCRGTVDGQILKFHEEGRDIMRALIRDPEAAVGA